jgi:hypothetical protein
LCYTKRQIGMETNQVQSPIEEGQQSVNHAAYYQKPPQKKRWWILIVIIVCIALIVTGVVWVVSQDKEETKNIISDKNQDPSATLTVDPFPEDKDRDGLSATQEAELGTSDFEFDTDGDGLKDGEEVSVTKTDPLNPDTDGDGFGDGREVRKGFDPLSK